MPVQTKAKVIKNIELTKNYYKIILFCPEVAKRAKPGQFLEVKANVGCQPFLRRPFGVHRVDGLRIEMLYETLGQGSKALSLLKAGESLDIVGPLGNGFDYRAGKKVILVAGGMGVAPLFFLADTIKSRSVVLIGARTKKQLFCLDDFKKVGCLVKVSTDDGSKGFKGRVTGLLQRELRTADHGVSHIYACGPRPMLEEVCRLAKKYNLAAQISLEEHMACGIGACLGCVVKTIDGYKRVCKEGPVFEANEVIFKAGG